MRTCSRSGALIVFISLLLVHVSSGQEVNSTPPPNDAIIHHMEDLEQQVKELRAEVAALKDQDRDKDGDKAASAVPAAAQSNLVSGPATAPIARAVAKSPVRALKRPRPRVRSAARAMTVTP